ncbi:MAG: hypothetical protein A2V67_00470 [Deltaproteobacteria bacterium RBG_13_61_14]|nr:MAG: hypothetical protein A2V67_00470 [Deltaproteobacteria bacterium RBG_13_61_14]
MKLVITGAASAIGRAVLPVIEKEEAITEILALDLKEPKFTSPKHRFVKMDIRDPALVQAFQGYDTLLNFAFIVAELYDKDLTRDINIAGVRNVFQAATKAGIRKIVHFSSLAAYGAHPDNPIPIREDWPLRGHDNDECYYACQKIETEAMLRALAKERPEIVITIFRPGVVLGRHLNPDFEALVRHRVFFRFLGRDPKWSGVHEDDVAEAVRLALIEDHPGAYNLVADDYLSLSQMGGLMNQVQIPIPFPLAEIFLDLGFKLHLPGFPISRESLRLLKHHMVGSNEKIKKEFGWKLLKSARESLRESYAYFQSRPPEKKPDTRKRIPA